jgi:hypothetical protein
MVGSSQEGRSTTSIVIFAIVAALGLLAVVIVESTTTLVYAQTTATTTPEEEPTTTTPTNSTIQLVEPSAAAQQIINNTQAECVQAQFLPRGCVILVYESPTTVVLNGDVSIFGGSAESRRHYPNPFLWNAVDGFKAQGYTITSIEINGGTGNQSSSNKFNVIMSK